MLGITANADLFNANHLARYTRLQKFPGDFYLRNEARDAAVERDER